MKRWFLTGFAVLLAVGCSAADADRFNYIVGTQTIGSHYQFTDKTRLLETAEVIRGMGSNIIKFRLSRHYAQRNYAGPNPGMYKTLTDLAQNEPSIRAVFDMPFYYYVMWVAALQPVRWSDADGYTPQEAELEYREIYDLAAYLLTTYNGTGKSFYFGHWEGDWLLVKRFDSQMDPIPHRVENMIRWLNNRQRAIDDAKRDHPDSDVRIFHYSEVNLVMKGLRGEKCYTTEVLPHVNVDYVSYSAYDAQKNPEWMLPAALDFIQQHLPAKKGFDGKRAFVGEFGYKVASNSPEQQKERSLEFVRAAIEWGCPFVLHWQLYDNEFENGKYNGFWLIDNHGEKQPLFHAFEKYYTEARGFAGQPPQRFRRKAIQALQ